MNVTFKPLTTQDEWFWFQNRTHVLLCEDMQGIIAYRNDEIIAACVFDTWTSVGANVHLAIDDPLALRHGLLQEAAAHAFIRGNKQKLFGLVPSNNKKAIKMNKHVGFEVVTEIPDSIEEGVGMVVMVITREKAERWLPNREEAA